MLNLNFLNVKQGTPEWLAIRREKIGASDAPIIMEMSPWKTPYQLMQEKLGLSESRKTSAMQYGIDTEETARLLFESMTRLVVFPSVVVSKERPWQMASLDGLCIDECAAVEIKCPGESDHNAALEGHVPSHYLPQLQHQMEVCGLEMIFYFSYRKGDGKIIEVKRDQSFIDLMNEKEERFWMLRQKEEMPELIARDYTDMTGNSDWEIVAKKLSEINGLYKTYEAQAEALKGKLKEMCPSSAARGYGVSLIKHSSKGAIDYSKIPELTGVDLEAYRKNSFTKWRTSFTNKSD